MPVRRAAGGQAVKGLGKGSRTKTPPDAPAPVRVFISYCHRDDGARDRLDVHMAQLKREGVSVFFDGDMIAGTELDPRIRRELRLAEIFVALASPAYLHSRYCFETEYGYAMRKAKRGGIHLVVALVEECQWRHTRMARYKLLPRDGKPVSKWRPHGDAYEDIVNGLRGVVKVVKAQRSTATEPWKTRGSMVPGGKRLTATGGASPTKSATVKPKRTSTLVSKQRAPSRKSAPGPRSGTPRNRGARPRPS
ncbi:toll/interleukin-1 receptor domain-containing protein [Methylobacterium sp. 092160098-2]|uniref:toll/interleukin-1 receptor domain-containing protein n=1 Tax=Methylobacterium sp. 092160098-2 TaxID=3025129 RepID=UPI00238198EF|nr:toll/interleukin-1 receptor domain-containing protein [Methylobacterium sp. 092160098-2]MDE4915111.1 toll/interleukin-1 receptor domain-containing protein [Methylobacterium sp. 092160098-2]